MDDKAYMAVVFTLVVLIGVAMWQFLSLVNSDAPGNRYTVGAPDTPGGMSQKPMPAAKPK
ncbi:MAG TPA: hypothetical protein VLA02_16760 [Reyranella sp.]|nr:hypothetical protein [Reyranella sp.]